MLLFISFFNGANKLTLATHTCTYNANQSLLKYILPNCNIVGIHVARKQAQDTRNKTKHSQTTWALSSTPDPYILFIVTDLLQAYVQCGQDLTHVTNYLDIIILDILFPSKNNQVNHNILLWINLMFVLKGLLFALFDTLSKIKQWQSNTFQGNEMLLFTDVICKLCLNSCQSRLLIRPSLHNSRTKVGIYNQKHHRFSSLVHPGITSFGNLHVWIPLHKIYFLLGNQLSPIKKTALCKEAATEIAKIPVHLGNILGLHCHAI